MSKNFNEVLKERELNAAKEDKAMSLDSTERVKVLSPGQMVFKRFITNKLAIVGSIILIVMFTFAFIVPIFYRYGQTEIFYKYDNSLIDYAQATERTEYSVLLADKENKLDSSIKNKLTATITEMKGQNLDRYELQDSQGVNYAIERFNDEIYSLVISNSEVICNVGGTKKIGTYDTLGKTLKYDSNVEEIDGLEEKVAKAISDGKTEFNVGSTKYTLKKSKKTYSVTATAEGFNYAKRSLGADFEELVLAQDGKGEFEYLGSSYSVATVNGEVVVYVVTGRELVAQLTTNVFNAYSLDTTFSDEFKFEAINATMHDGAFTADGKDFEIKKVDGEYVVFEKGGNEPFASLSTLVIRRYSGEDTLEYEFKEAAKEVIEDMKANGVKTGSFTWEIAQVDSEGKYTYDENGELIKEPREVEVTEKNGSVVMRVQQVVYLIDSFAKPTKDHPVGTDGDGMDVFARMMYGGRVSLMVAFVVVILETVLGIIMGGIAGFFGGWVDNLIMRAVDIFYCIPSMPILIILGALFDSMKMKPYTRVMWLMVVLGVLGWASIARLVRGQILSLREQEFMVAAEAIGLKTKRRIFKHLIPNVMPQLIVTATSALGGVIITESTLSFLGLGVKHPLATWGTMINSVSTAEAMKTYTYIWVPVGLLICLTVIAFNFVGDGLRDAFDPKMKR